MTKRPLQLFLLGGLTYAALPTLAQAQPPSPYTCADWCLMQRAECRLGQPVGYWDCVCPPYDDSDGLCNLDSCCIYIGHS